MVCYKKQKGRIIDFKLKKREECSKITGLNGKVEEEILV